MAIFGENEPVLFILLLVLLSSGVNVHGGDCPDSPISLSQNCSPHFSNDQCKYHADCTESNHKCCKIGCQKMCLDVVEIRASVLGNSVCPALPRPSRCSDEPNQCIDQSECGAGRKCCSNGCRMVCVEPVIVPTTAAPKTLKWKSCNSSVDLAFIVDSSGSIGRTNYKKVKAFVKYVARTFGISPTESRAGIVLYSNDASVKVHLDQYFTIDEFVKAVDALPHERGYTRIDRGLQVASKELFVRARENVPKIAMVLTDGEQTKASDAISLKRASEPLRRAGVRVLAYGVGKKINVRELRSIVERDEDVIRVMKFDDLINKVRNYSARLCKAAGTVLVNVFLGEKHSFRQLNVTSFEWDVGETYQRNDFLLADEGKREETEPIKPDADIIFLVDSSTGISRGQFEWQKNFVRRLSRYFVISPLGPRAAFVSYASTSYTVIGFNDYQSPADFSSKINSAPLLGGSRRIDQVVDHAANMFRQSGRVGMRIVILLTAGTYYTGPGSRTVSSAMLPLRSLGAYTYVIGIGPFFTPTSFRQMVSGPSDIFQVPSFNVLLSRAPSFAKQLRLSTNGIRYEPATFRSDAVFLMDSSRYVRDNHYILEKNFVKLLARLLNLAENRTHAALYAFSDRPQLQITFDGYEDREAFEAAVNSAPHLRGSRRIDRAFESAVELFRTKSRESVFKYVILLTTGTQTPEFDMRQLDIATRGLRSHGVRVYVIAVLTGGYTTRDFYPAVQDPSHTFAVSTYSELLPRAPSIASRIMASWRAPKALNFAADIAFIVDSSSVLSPFQYSRAKRFVRILSEYLNVSPGKSRGAMVTFGESPVVAFDFDSYNTRTEFLNKVNDAPYLGGEPSIGTALHTAATLFSNARGSYPWLSILLTSWRPDDVRDTRQLEATARRLLHRGVWFYVLYIGENRDVSWLRPTVVEQRDAFSVVSYRDLPANIGLVSSHITSDNYLYGSSTFQLDLTFLIDTSSDVALKDLKIMKSFVQRVAMHLGIFARNSRAALMTYGDKPSIVFALGGYTSNSEFVRRLNEAVSVGGDRRIDRALETASTLLLDSRSTMPKAVVLITAGRQSNAPGSRSVETSARPLHKLGAWLYVVAIGPQANLNDLRKATIEPTDDVFAVRSFSELYGFIAPVAKHVANTSVITGTSPLNADIVFAIDCSSSVPFSQYAVQKSFVRTLAQYLNIQAGFSRAGLVVYGSRGLVGLPFDSSIARFDSAVVRAPYMGGGRRVDKALQVTTGLFSQARQRIPKVLLLLMAGAQATVPGVQSLQDSVKPLQELGVQTFVFRIGSEPNLKKILPVVDRPGNAFPFSSFGDLEERIPYIARHFPFYSVLLAPFSFAADIVFLMDSSEDVTPENYMHEKDFVIYLARYLNMMPTRSRGAVVTYGSTSTVASNFSDSSRIQTFENQVKDAPWKGGQRRMDQALDAANRILASARPAIPKVVILITAGSQPKSVQAGILEAAMKRLQDAGARVYAVTINTPNIRLPLRSSSGSDWFPVESFTDLPVLVMPLARHVLSDTAAIGPEDFVADVAFIIDSSSNITPTDYLHEKNFVKLITKYLNVVPGKSRAAVMFYSSTPAVVLPFDGYSTISEFNSVLDRASQLKGVRRTDRAFGAAAKLFESARPSVLKIALLLTGGRQSRGGSPLEEAVQPLRDLRVTTYVVDVTATSDVPVARPEDTFSVPSYAALQQYVEPVAREITKKRDGLETKPKADLVFVMDSSNESASSFNVEKDFVKSLARYFSINPEGFRAALIVFNGRPSVIADFNAFSSASNFARTVDGAPYLGGSRGISDALNAAAGIFPQSQLSTSRIVFLVTPGKPIRSQDGRSVSEVLQKLRAIGVRTYVALIGREPDVEVFKTAIEDPGRVFSIASRDDITHQTNRVGKEVLTDSVTPKKLNLTMYVMLVVDASSEITPTNFQQEKEFIKLLLGQMNLYPENSASRVGIIVYGDGATVVLDPDNKETKSSIDKIVDKLLQVGGVRRIDKALRTADDAFSKVETDRPKFIVLLTAGPQTNAADAESFSKAVRPLHDAGTITHVLGIGDDVDPNDFRGAEQEKTEVITVRSFSELPEYVEPISKNLIKGYVAPRKFQLCPFSSYPRGCPDLVSNECMTDEECFSPSSFCCSDGCRNICFDISSTTQMVPTTMQRTNTKKTSIKEKPTTTAKTPITTEKRTMTEGTTTTDIPTTTHRTTTTKKPTKTKQTTITGKITTPRQLGQKARTTEVTETSEPVTSKEREVDSRTPARPRATTEPQIPTSAQVKVAFSRPSDIVFLIDASRDVSQADLAKQKQFVKLMAKYFGVSPSQSHAALITYSDTTRLIGGFYHYVRDQTFEDVVDSVRLTRGRRRFDQALSRARDALTEARPSVPKAVILLANGRQAPEFGFPRLQEATRGLLDTGATLYITGVGLEQNDLQLRPAVSRPGDFFAIPSSDDLLSYAPSVAYYVASRTDGNIPRGFKADVIYVLDSSSAVGAENFETEKDFTRALARILNHGPTQTRSAVMVFDSEAIGFEEHSEIGPFSDAIKNLTYVPTGEISLAVRLAAASFPFPRHGVARVLVVLTNKDPTSRRYVEYSAARIREQGVFVNVIGIGEQREFPNLRRFTVSPGDFFAPRTFDDLMGHVPRVADNIAARSPLYTQASKATTTAVIQTTTAKAFTTTQQTTLPSTTAELELTTNERLTTPAVYFTTKEVIRTKETTVTKKVKVQSPATLTTARPKVTAPGSEKPGYCPVRNIRSNCQPYLSSCLLDRNCLGNKKCCFDGCRFSCLTPVDKPPVPPTPEKGKTGACPARFTVPCPGQHSCEHDRQCPGGQKCCSHSCGFLFCSAVRKPDKPGSCPNLARPSSCPSRTNECYYDENCSGDLKCCTNGCGNVCVSTTYSPPPPIDFLPGKCPPYTPRMNCPSLVQDECTCDSDCETEQGYKCCYDGCRRFCRKKAGKVCTAKVDIIYLMDSSGSISKLDFQKQKDFVKDLVRIFNISPSGSHGGVVTYSDFPVVRTNFGNYDSSETFAQAVDAINQTRGRTRIDRALKKTSEMFESARKNVRKVLIVLTDGRQTPDPDAVPLKNASQPLRDQGVRTYAIGVGHKIDKEELRLMVENDDDVFTVDSFQDLVRQSQTIAERACQEEISRCVQAIDIAFLMDSSESITADDFEREKRAVKVIAESFVKSSKDSRAGVIMYSGQPELSVDFSRQNEFDKFKSAVNALPHRRSMTRIDRALQFASTSLFENPRPSVSSIAVVMTDGVQTPGSGVQPVGQAVLPLRLKGVRVLAVGVGPRVDLKELNAIAASKDDVFRMSSFQELLDKANQLLQAVCPDTTIDPIAVNTTKETTTTLLPTPSTTKPSTKTRPRPKCDILLEIVFVMDSSRSIDGSEYVNEKGFVKELATIFNVGSGSRAAVIVYSDDPKLAIEFDQYKDLASFSLAVDRLPYLQKRTRIDKALDMASRVLRQARPGIPRVVIVMTDGRQTRDVDAVSLDVAADAIHRQGARILVVGIGSTIDTTELLLMARDIRFVFPVQSFQNLIKAAQDVSLSACSSTVLPTASSFVTTTSTTEEPQGFCPVFPVRRCLDRTRTCLSDVNCPERMKCCFDNCKYVCANPVIPAAPSPGPITLPPTTVPGSECTEAFDLAFAMDSSGSIRDENYDRAKDFVKGLADKLLIRPQGVHLGLLLFSDVPLISVRFGTLKSTDRASFAAAVDGLPYLRGRTRIDSALYTAATVLFPEGRQDKVPQVLFLMTDGRQSKDEGAMDLVQAVTPLRSRGIKVIVIGIGADIDKKELESIVDSPKDDVFLVPSFFDLKQLLDDDELTESLCISAKKRMLQNDQS